MVMQSCGIWNRAALAVLLAASFAAPAVARADFWEWPDQGLGVPGSGAGYYARDMAVWDDGRGAALYVGGLFLYAGGKQVITPARK